VEKVRNGQALKAAMVIIVDNIDENVETIIPFIEGGQSMNIRIPSIILDHETGSSLLQDVRKLSNDQNIHIIGSVSFTITQSFKSQIVYKFDLNDRELFETFFDLLNFYHGVKDHIEITPGYNIFPAVEKPSDKKFCLRGYVDGKTYCEAREDGQEVSRENQPIFESIRQICLARANIEAWYNYVGMFFENCMKFISEGKTQLVVELATCSNKIVSKLDTKFRSAIETMQNCADQLDGDTVRKDSHLQRYLEENLRIRMMVATPIRPSIMINGQVIYGRMTSEDVLKEICASLVNKPQECQLIEKLSAQLKYVEFDQFTMATALLYLFKLLMCGLVVIVAFYLIYKIKLRKELEGRITKEVDTALATYYMKKKPGEPLEGEETLEEDQKDSRMDHKYEQAGTELEQSVVMSEIAPEEPSHSAES